ncbi:MAG: cytosolic protein, partial [Verrucomicrobiota bacterium]
MQQPGPDCDAIWKETFMGFFHECMERFNPAFARKIDRSRKVRFLDKELRALLGRSPRPRQHVDLLAEVPLRGVGLDTMLTHVEVQRHKVAQFAQRMLFYHAALVRRFRQPVMSLAILADPDPKWRPNGLTSGIEGSGTRFEFPICKLLDFTDAELESDPNPVNLVI